MHYHDLVIHCRDTAELVAEAEAKLPGWIARDEAGGARLVIDKTPTIRTGDETLALVRLTDAALAEWETAGLESARILGTFEAIFADPELLAVYDRIVPRQDVVPGAEGEPPLIPPPRPFGAFA